jgi:hypothetical protein
MSNEKEKKADDFYKLHKKSIIQQYFDFVEQNHSFSETKMYALGLMYGLFPQEQIIDKEKYKIFINKFCDWMLYKHSTKELEAHSNGFAMGCYQKWLLNKELKEIKKDKKGKK